MSDTLEAIIDRYKNLGEKDPHTISTKVIASLGDDLVEVARPYLADFITELARQRLGNDRRAEIARITPQLIETNEVMLKSIWIPSGQGGITYKKIAEATADDFDARAAYLERLVAGIARHARWCRDVADQIRYHGVTTAGELTSLPPLPGIKDDVDQPALPLAS